jgi:hypothetical protein
MRTSRPRVEKLQRAIGSSCFAAVIRPVSPSKKIAHSSPSASPGRPRGQKIV